MSWKTALLWGSLAPGCAALLFAWLGPEWFAPYAPAFFVPGVVWAAFRWREHDRPAREKEPER